MCGRCRCTLRLDDIPRACYLEGRPVRHLDMDRYKQAYNVSPGSNLPVVRRDDASEVQGAVIQSMKWGLVPSFTKKTDKPDHFKMFNARSESIMEKTSFRRLVPNSRCLVAVEGFYEWKKDGSKKQPYYIHFKDGRPLVFAALYDSWKSSDGDVLYTFTILTTSSSSALAWLHDRMPVILGDKSSTDVWLNGSSSSKFDALLKAYGESDLVWYPVTPAIGKTTFNGPECIKQLQLKTEQTKPISNFFGRKASKNDQELKLQVRVGKEPVEAKKPTILKEELKTEDNPDHQSCTEQSNYESTSNVSTVTSESLAGFQSKREYEEFSADTKPSMDQINEQFTSPASKKGKIDGAGDKQPTLYSYFWKK